jgi:hypothetical protein
MPSTNNNPAIDATLCEAIIVCRGSDLAEHYNDLANEASDPEKSGWHDLSLADKKYLIDRVSDVVYQRDIPGMLTDIMRDVSHEFILGREVKLPASAAQRTKNVDTQPE